MPTSTALLTPFHAWCAGAASTWSGRSCGRRVVSWASASDYVSAADVARPSAPTKPNMESAFRREIGSGLVFSLMPVSPPVGSLFLLY
jgi:hypothetical protein